MVSGAAHDVARMVRERATMATPRRPARRRPAVVRRPAAGAWGAAGRVLALLVAVVVLGQAGHVGATGGPSYSGAEVAHFEALGLGSEYGGASPVVRRWQGTVRVSLAGEPTADDRATLASVVAELAALVAPVRIDVVQRSADITVHLVPPADFASIVPDYVPGNDGFFSVWWQADVLERGAIVVDRGAPADVRAHLVRHELVQTMGLMIDSDDPGSVLFGRPTRVTSLTALDRVALRLLYDQRIRPGMTAAEVEAAVGT